MTSEEFYTKLKGFAKINPQTMFIIESVPKEDHDRQIRARAMWLSYLDANGLKLTAKTWKAIWAGGGKAVTVPTEDPRNFDLKYHPPGDATRRASGDRWQAKPPPQPRQYRED